MVEPDSIEQSIRAGLACTHLEVTGDGAHFEATVVSPSFAGWSPRRLLKTACETRTRSWNAERAPS